MREHVDWIALQGSVLARKEATFVETVVEPPCLLIVWLRSLKLLDAGWDFSGLAGRKTLGGLGRRTT